MYVLIQGWIFIGYEIFDDYVFVVVNGLIDCVCLMVELLLGIE